MTVAAKTRTVSIGTTPVNIRKTPGFKNDPAAYPVSYSALRYASGGANLALVGNPFATGYLLFVSNPADSETIAVNSVSYTFKTTPAGATDILIGASKEATAQNLATALSQSVSASLTIAQYQVGKLGVPNQLDIISTTPGTGGNSFALANSSSAAVTRSASTLTGGPAYADGQPIDAGQDFSDVDQSIARYVVGDATGPTSLLVTDYFA